MQYKRKKCEQFLQKAARAMDSKNTCGLEKAGGETAL